jgi:hypothetical protein
MQQPQKIWNQKPLLGVVIGGLALVALLVGISLTAGLPGLSNSATTHVNGQSVVGKTGSD